MYYFAKKFRFFKIPKKHVPGTDFDFKESIFFKGQYQYIKHKIDISIPEDMHLIRSLNGNFSNILYF